MKKINLVGSIFFMVIFVLHSVCAQDIEKGYPLKKEVYKTYRNNMFWGKINTLNFNHVSNRFLLYSQAMLSLDTASATPYKTAFAVRTGELQEKILPQLEQWLSSGQIHLLEEEKCIVVSLMFRIRNLGLDTSPAIKCNALTGLAQRACLVNSFGSHATELSKPPLIVSTGGGGSTFHIWRELLNIDYSNKVLTNQDVITALQSKGVLVTDESIFNSNTFNKKKLSPSVDQITPLNPGTIDGRNNLLIDQGSLNPGGVIQ